MVKNDGKRVGNEEGKRKIDEMEDERGKEILLEKRKDERKIILLKGLAKGRAQFSAKTRG